jgi:tRNA pseudouridine55 synthase
LSAFGLLNIDKPLQMTSHDVVAKVRRYTKIKKVGHAGTLDPLATGVLVLCVGRATRLSEYVMHTTKRYQARVHLGVTTDTYDAEGTVQQERDASHITCEQLETALTDFTGDIEQVPPMYSAIKQGGRKLYELARAGEVVERPARQITIDQLVIQDWSPPLFTLDVMCSAGTYIRSLAYDLGEVLGVGAHLAGLVRTASGAFHLEQAIKLNTLLDNPNWQDYLIPADQALAHLPALHLDEAAYDHIGHGRAIPGGDGFTDDTLARAYAPDGNFVAILRAKAGIWHPHKVFLNP